MICIKQQSRPMDTEMEQDMEEMGDQHLARFLFQRIYIYIYIYIYSYIRIFVYMYIYIYILYIYIYIYVNICK